MNLLAIIIPILLLVFIFYVIIKKRKQILIRRRNSRNRSRSKAFYNYVIKNNNNNNNKTKNNLNNETISCPVYSCGPAPIEVVVQDINSSEYSYNNLPIEYRPSAPNLSPRKKINQTVNF